MFEFVLDGAALHRSAGEPATTMVAQLRRLAERAAQPNVTILVVPYRRGTYPGLVTGSSTLLDFPTDRRYGTLPSAVRVERQGEELLLDGADEIAHCEERWGDVLARALDGFASRGLILDVAQRIEGRDR